MWFSRRGAKKNPNCYRTSVLFSWSVSKGNVPASQSSVHRRPPGCSRRSSFASPRAKRAPPCHTFPHALRVYVSAYVDEHVEARYEEIINHLHKALSSTEQDEQDFKVNGRTLSSGFVVGSLNVWLPDLPALVPGPRTRRRRVQGQNDLYIYGWFSVLSRHASFAGCHRTSSQDLKRECSSCLPSVARL